MLLLYGLLEMLCNKLKMVVYVEEQSNVRRFLGLLFTHPCLRKPSLAN